MTTQLQQDIKQTRPFRSLPEETFLNVLRASATLMNGLAELLRPANLTQPQYNVLRILRGAGPAGLPSGEIGERMLTRDPDVTRLIDRMEKLGLVSRERDTRDRRVVIVRIAEQGRHVVDDLDQDMLILHQNQLGHLGEERMRLLIDLLQEVWQPRAAPAVPRD